MFRLFSLILAIALLSACSGINDRLPEPSPGGLIDLELIGAVVAGDYVSIRPQGESGSPVLLQIASEASSDGLSLHMNQRQNQTERHFRLDLSDSGSQTGQVNGRFIPLHSQTATACDMVFRLAGGRLTGTTDPGECRFRSGSQMIGLLKELAFDGDTILMADQLLLDDGSPLGETDRLSLARAARFEGSVSRREGEVWRIARSVSVATGGKLVEPVDAAGMSLGLVLNLELIDSSSQDLPALRLQLLDQAAESTQAEVWSDVDADLIGLRLDHTRLELRRVQ